jgi:SAM-dependent methyltransferase
MATSLVHFCTTEYVAAGKLDLLEAVMAGQNLTIPQPYSDGRIPTLNGTGANTPVKDNITQAFLDQCSADTRVLEIGAGYGLVCEQALQNGCQEYVANDSDVRHLQIMACRLQGLGINLEHLKLEHATFPQVELSDNYFDAILAARVLHFMNPKQLTQAVQKIYDLLVPGGKVYVITVSPYMKGYAPFLAEFSRRVANNDPHPGYVINKRDWADTTVLPQRVLDDMKSSMYFFDTHTLQAVFITHGFEVELCEYRALEYDSPMWQLDGRENTVLIARKPQLLA